MSRRRVDPDHVRALATIASRGEGIDSLQAAVEEQRKKRVAYEESLIAAVLNYLDEGGEQEALDTLASCSLEIEWDIDALNYEVVVRAPRPVYDALQNPEHSIVQPITKVFRDVARSLHGERIPFKRLRLYWAVSDSPSILRESLKTTAYRTGDTKLDEMLETARAKFQHPDPKVRLESLEKLWDAWERLKTLEPGKDKKASADALLDKAASHPRFRQLLANEADELTKIGNDYMIRHSETNKIPIERDEYADYLFHRLFALIQLLLRCR